MSKTAHELTRKEMKGPDRFQQVAAEAAEWMAKHRKAIAIAVGVVLVAAVAAVAVQAFLDVRRDKAGGLLFEAIHDAGGEVSAVPLPNAEQKLFKTAQEKQRAVLEAAKQVEAKAGGSRAATTALLLEGDAHLGLSEWDQAIAAYQGYLSKAPAEEPLRYGAFDGLARAQEGKGDLAAAARTYQEATAISVYKDRANIERARVLARAGQKDEARRALEAVPAESHLRADAQERLRLLGAK